MKFLGVQPAIMQPSHVITCQSCTLYSLMPGYGLTFVHMLTYIPNPCALPKKKMVGKDVSKLEYSPVTKTRESEAVLVRLCSSCLGEYGLTLWVVSILMYTQELHQFFFVSCIACHMVQV